MAKPKMKKEQYKWWGGRLRGIWLDSSGNRKSMRSPVIHNSGMFSDVRMPTWNEGVAGWKGDNMGVSPGQIWEDLDKRMGGRRVKVLNVDLNYAYCVGIESGRHVRILIRRMRPISNGFRYWGEG